MAYSRKHSLIISKRETSCPGAGLNNLVRTRQLASMAGCLLQLKCNQCHWKYRLICDVAWKNKRRCSAAADAAGRDFQTCNYFSVRRSDEQVKLWWKGIKLEMEKLKQGGKSFTETLWHSDGREKRNVEIEEFMLTPVLVSSRAALDFMFCLFWLCLLSKNSMCKTDSTSKKKLI